MCHMNNFPVVLDTLLIRLWERWMSSCRNCHTLCHAWQQISFENIVFIMCIQNLGRGGKSCRSPVGLQVRTSPCLWCCSYLLHCLGWRGSFMDPCQAGEVWAACLRRHLLSPTARWLMGLYPTLFIPLFLAETLCLNLQYPAEQTPRRWERQDLLLVILVLQKSTWKFN